MSACAVRLFYSYAHEDEALRDELERHLKILERKKLIAPWHDRRIGAGSEWDGQIDANLCSAELVLLLVSSHFMASDYIVGQELTAAMSQHESGRSVVAWVLLSPLDLQPDDTDVAPFLKLQGLPPDLRPVTSWPQRDEAWVIVARELRETVARIRAQRVDGAGAADAMSDSGFDATVEVSPGVALPAQHEPREPESLPPSLPPSERSRPGVGGISGITAGIGRGLRDLLERTFSATPRSAPSDTRALPPPSPRTPSPADTPDTAIPPAPDTIFDALLDTVSTPIAQAARERGVAEPDRARLDRAATWLIDRDAEPPRVLWVDNRPQGNLHERAALARLQIEVRLSNGTADALAQLHDAAASDAAFDLVLSDWERPRDGRDAGLALARAMRAAGHAQPIVYYHDAMDPARRAERRQHALEAGALGEAVMPQELIEAVVHALGGSLAA